MKTPTDVTGDELVKILERMGFVLTRQRGSHMILRRDSPYARVVVPDHRPIRVGTLRSILSDAGISIERFIALR